MISVNRLVLQISRVVVVGRAGGGYNMLFPVLRYKVRLNRYLLLYAPGNNKYLLAKT